MRGPDVEAHPAVGHVGAVQLAPLRVGVEAVAEHEVERQQQPAAADASALSSALRASSTPSSSTSESPVGLPCARKKLKHIAPPIRSVSAMSRKRSISAILSVTFAPPSTTTSGRSGLRRWRSVVTSRSSSRPATAGAGARPRRPSTRARGAPSRTRRRRRRRRARRAARQRGVVLGLAALPARVLEHEHAARLEPLDAAPHLGPTTSGAWCTGASSSSPRRARDRRRARSPGRVPWAGRGASTGSAARPRSRSSSIVGSAARMRASSVDPRRPQRHVEVHARPARARPRRPPGHGRSSCRKRVGRLRSRPAPPGRAA